MYSRVEMTKPVYFPFASGNIPHQHGYHKWCFGQSTCTSFRDYKYIYIYLHIHDYDIIIEKDPVGRCVYM